jgi:hypothetical protein
MAMTTSSSIKVNARRGADTHFRVGYTQVSTRLHIAVLWLFGHKIALGSSFQQLDRLHLRLKNLHQSVVSFEDNHFAASAGMVAW